MQLVQPKTMAESGAHIAHEVNQPLTAILVNAETALGWLAHDPPNLEAARRAVERVIGNGQRADQIVRSIRSLSRGSSPEMADVDINGVVENILGLAGWELSREDVVVETELDRDLPLVRGDRGQLERVLTNLFVNAVEAMGAVQEGGRTVRIRTRSDEEGRVLVAVEDSGPGLDPATAERIFEPLFTTKRDGMGLGLSICRSIVEAHGGSLWATSNFRRGSTFSFSLPAPRPVAPRHGRPLCTSRHTDCSTSHE